MDSSKEEPVIRYEIEKEKYTSMVFAKNPPMIKLKRNSLGVYHKRIQLDSGFWDKNCVPFSIL